MEDENPSTCDSALCVGVWLWLPLQPALIASIAFCISSMRMAMGTAYAPSLPRWYLLVRLLQVELQWAADETSILATDEMGHTFIAVEGLLRYHSMEIFPCSFLSRSSKILANPSLGCARRCTFFSMFHASRRVQFLKRKRGNYEMMTASRTIKNKERCNSNLPILTDVNSGLIDLKVTWKIVNLLIDCFSRGELLVLTEKHDSDDIVITVQSYFLSIR